MRVILLALCLLAGLSCKAQLDRISVAGNRFVSEKGPVIFRGLDASDPYKLQSDGYWNKQYLAEVKNWGANIVRFPVHPIYWRKLGQEKYVQLLDQGVAWAAQLGLYVIIDWHSIGNLRSELFQDPMYETTRKETLEFWKVIAEHYKDNSTVAFFELFNEPTDGHGTLGTCSWVQWKELMEEMIIIIRAHGAKAVPLVAGFNWAYDLTEVERNPVAAEGIAYVSHPYPMKRDKPWEPQWTKDWGYVSEKYPVFLTEIGFCGKDDRGAHVPVISDESYGNAITAYSDQHGISYTVWIFDPDWAPMLIEDWKFTPTRQGKFFKKVLQQVKR
jgi:endoglucanase